MFWPQGSYRSQWRPALGNYPGGVYYASPSGRPLMTPEITSPQPEHVARTFHCYVRNGQYTVAPFAQRDALKAAGWEETDYANCAGSGVPMAQPVGTPAPALFGRQQLSQAVPLAESPISGTLFPLTLVGALGVLLLTLVLVD